MSEPFRTRRRLRFADCDPAGIAYYPRLFEMGDGVVEDWCEEVLGVPRRISHMEQGLGLPTVRLDAEFIAPSFLGDWLDFELNVTSVGRSSIGFDLVAACAGELRFRVCYTQVLMDLHERKAKPWPDEWRRRFA